jgi:CheY-like chemotaxis protein/nitrogen-specific signal transduction histidine kinase
MGFVHDISERKQAEEERAHLLAAERAARSEAEKTGRFKDEFLATVSHELRSPLNAILGWAQLLKRESNAEIVANGIDAILNSGRMQSQFIEDLLDMNRIITGKLRLEVQTVEPARTLQQALELVRPSAEAKGIRIETQIDPTAGPLQGDPVRLQQVLWNLLGNAVKFTPNGGKVRVLLQRQDSQVELRVSDTGIGIRPEFLPHVFDRFRQADSSSARQQGGLGLGLGIARQIVELHGGRIVAFSEGEGKGATFRVRLPISIALPAEAKTPVTPHVVRPDMKLTGVRMLVVDDDPGAADMLRLILTNCEAEVEMVHSGQEALQRIATRKPDIVLCDIGMPMMDGLELIRRLRADGRTLPAIAVTSFARAEDRSRALQAGFDMYVSKPIDARELIAAVERLLRREAPTLGADARSPGHQQYSSPEVG